MRLYNIIKNIIKKISDSLTSANAYTDSKLKTASGTGTKTSAVASVERCTWVQVGKIVQVTATFTTAASGVGNTTTFFTGLPAPQMYSRIVATRAYESSCFRLSLEENGTLNNAYSAGTLTSQTIEVGFTYIAKDFVS